MHRAQRSCERHALPLPAREIGAAGIAARQHRIETSQLRRACGFERRVNLVVRGARGRNVVAQGKLEACEVLEHRGDSRAPRVDLELSYVDPIHFDRARLRVVESTQQLCQRRLAGAVLPDNGE